MPILMPKSGVSATYVFENFAPDIGRNSLFSVHAIRVTGLFSELDIEKYHAY